MSGFDPGEGWREASPNDATAGTEHVVYSDGERDHYWVREAPVPPLPTDAGTVITVGAWRFVLTETLAGGAAWFLLAPATQAAADSMTRANVRAGAGYSSEFVLAEAQQEGGFEVLASPANQADCVKRMEQVKRETAEAVLHEAEAFFDRAWMPGKMRVLSYDTQAALFARVRNRFGVES